MLTRFAPAPTGYLHLGHVANAIFVWGMARARGAAVALRIEDHDGARCRPEYEAALLDDLDWLGFVPDHFPTAEFRAGRCLSRQQDRHQIYAAAAARLHAAGRLYGCTCSRQEIARLTGGAGDELVYPGTCAGGRIPLADRVGWRLRLEPGHESWTDELCGPQTQDPSAQCGDLLVRDRDGHWTYQFAAAVDDFMQGVTLVIRGRDLLSSTGRQIRIARLLGRATPAAFAHHPLIMKSPTQKLSKSDRDSGVRDMRAAGWTPARVIGQAAFAVGLTAEPRDVAAREVGALAFRQRIADS